MGPAGRGVLALPDVDELACQSTPANPKLFFVTPDIAIAATRVLR
jgi:hypothetical protein